MRLYILVFILIVVNGYMYSKAYDFDMVLPQLSDQKRSNLLNGNFIDRSSNSSSNKNLQFLPNVKHANKIHSYIKETNPSILYEILLFIPNDRLQETVDAIQTKQFAIIFNPELVTSKQSIVMIHYYNLLRNITLFSEIRYTNLKDKNVHPLFNTSDRITSKKDKTIIPILKPVRSLTYITIEEPIFILQDMPPFGDVVSEYDYVYNADDLSFIGKNLTYISYNGFAVVRPNDMFITSQIARTNKGVLIYGLGSVRISGLGIFFGSIINNSFISRMVGFFEWISSQ